MKQKRWVCVNKDYLTQKLDKAGLNSNIISIISSFLSNRYQCVSNSGCKSFLPINVGTQGTKLDPILWFFYINDLQANTSGVHLIKYADDNILRCYKKKEQAGKNKNNIVQKDSIVHTSLLQKEIQNAELFSANNDF